MSDGLVEVTSPNGERLYCLTNGKSLPEWMEESKKRKLRKVEEFRSRIELIQGLYFPVSCQKLKYTNDGNFLVGVGTYKPRCNIYELRELSLKTERIVDHEIVEFQILSDDWTKMVFLRSDRYLEFHSKTGAGYYHTRVPRVGRDLVYDQRTCELVVAGNSSEVYRLNLEIGSFLKPFQTSQATMNKCRINQQNGLYGFCGNEGIVEFWDPRSKKPVGFLDAGKNAMEISNGVVTEQPEATALEFHPNGLHFGVGTSSGQVMIYDLRAPIPVQSKDHQYGQPIVDLMFHSSSKNVISACKRIVKIWDQNDASLLCSIEPPNDINGFCAQENSGIIFIGGEQPKVHTYYLPFLGPAPKWCCFLDNVTLEVERAKEKPVYQDYKFITPEEIEQLGIEKMVGTPYLRAYMHGYFIDIRLYNKIRSLVNPEAYSDWKKAKVKERMDRKIESRITLQKAGSEPKVNTDLANKLLEKNISEEKKEDLLHGRFSSIFSNPAFQIDSGKRVVAPRKGQHDLSDAEESDESSEKSGDDESDDEDTFSEVGDSESISESNAEIDDITSAKIDTAKLKRKHEEPIDMPEKSEKKVKLYEGVPHEFKKSSADQKQKEALGQVRFDKRLAVESNGGRQLDGDVGAFQMTFKMNAAKKEKADSIAKLKEHKERNPNRRTMKHNLPIMRGRPGSRNNNNNSK